MLAHIATLLFLGSTDYAHQHRFLQSPNVIPHTQVSLSHAPRLDKFLYYASKQSPAAKYFRCVPLLGLLGGLYINSPKLQYATMGFSAMWNVVIPNIINSPKLQYATMGFSAMWNVVIPNIIIHKERTAWDRASGHNSHYVSTALKSGNDVGNNTHSNDVLKDIQLIYSTGTIMQMESRGAFHNDPTQQQLYCYADLQPYIRNHQVPGIDDEKEILRNVLFTETYHDGIFPTKSPRKIPLICNMLGNVLNTNHPQTENTSELIQFINSGLQECYDYTRGGYQPLKDFMRTKDKMIIFGEFFVMLLGATGRSRDSEFRTAYQLAQKLATGDVPKYENELTRTMDLIEKFCHLKGEAKKATPT